MITVRKMEAGDRTDYVRMATDFYSGHATLYPVTEKKLDDTIVTAERHPELTALYIIEANGETAGYANLSYTWSTEGGGMVCWIEELYLAPAYRGLGYGTEFFRWVFDSHRDYVRFRLEVSPENPDAAKLYQRVGFTPIGYESYVLDRN